MGISMTKTADQGDDSIDRALNGDENELAELFGASKILDVPFEFSTLNSPGMFL
jgi:hypothetical protein